MKFLQKFIPGFLNKIDHRLLINKPVIWRTRAHYLLFYASIIIAIIFSVGCFYPHSIYEEVYQSAGNRDNIAIIITAIMSLVVIIFWSSRLYQYKTKISRWKHFFYTFCIYFFCLFILFTSLFCFHYGSFINRCNLLTDYKSTYEDLIEKNYFAPNYYPHYQENVLGDLDGYIENCKSLSSEILRVNQDKDDFPFGFKGQEHYQHYPVEYFERLNIIKEYLKNLEEDSVEGGTNIPEVYIQKANEAEVDGNEIAKRALTFGLGEEQIKLIRDEKPGSAIFYEKAELVRNVLDKEGVQMLLANPKKLDYMDFRYTLWQDNHHALSAMLARYELYLRLRNFVASLSEVQYQAYFDYLKQLDASEQNQFYFDDYTIQHHEISSVLSHAKIDESVRLFDPSILITKEWNQWSDRFYTFGVTYTEEVTSEDRNRVAMLTEFYEKLSPDQAEAYRKYIHFTRILNQETDNSRSLSVFNSETGLQDFVFKKCDQYFLKNRSKVDRLDSVIFFNYFDNASYSIQLSPEYYPKIIQKQLFDQFYEADQGNNEQIRNLMTKNNIVERNSTNPADFVNNPENIFKRQFLMQAFEHVGIIRKEATSLVTFISFLLVNIVLSFCVAILIFYLSSIERNTILLSILIMGLVYISLLTVGSLSPELVGGFAMLFYLIFSIGLFVVVYRSTFQVRRVKLLITCYIFYAISIQPFMIANEDFIIDIGIAPEWMAMSILLFTFLTLFLFSYYFIRYIQLPVR